MDENFLECECERVVQEDRQKRGNLKLSERKKSIISQRDIYNEMGWRMEGFSLCFKIKKLYIFLLFESIVSYRHQQNEKLSTLFLYNNLQQLLIFQQIASSHLSRISEFYKLCIFCSVFISCFSLIQPAKYDFRFFSLT